MTQKFHSGIKVAGRAVEYWGSQSISSDSSAIFELVKNARDADASKVEITFENVENPGGRIIIKDDGNGMTRDDVEAKWLVAGTNFKVLNPQSRGGRRVWGEMGIGRFSCERLSNKTTMTSYPRDSNEKIEMIFDWKKYKDPNVTFDQVEHEGLVDVKEEKSKHGLELVLEDLKSSWGVAKIRNLKRELGSHILPPELKGPEDFDIKITADEFSMSDEQVESAVIKLAPLRMRAEFDGDTMTVKIYDVENEVKKWHEREPTKYEQKTCGPFKFGLFFYPLDKSGETKWSTYYQDHLKDMDIRDFLRNHSGIYLYRDYAWMKPYGGSNDWLGLEGRRVQRRSKIGRTQVYGIVSITKETNPEIKPTAHREVLQANTAFDDLKSIIMDAIKETENYREETKVSIQKPSVQTEMMVENNISQITKLCKSKESLSSNDIKKIAQYAATTQKYIEEFKKETEDIISEKSDVRQHELNVLSIGLVTSYVAHEVSSPLESMVEVLGDVREMMETTDFTKVVSGDLVTRGFDWLGTLEENTRKLIHFLSFVNELSSHIAASKAIGGRATQFKIRNIWEPVSKGFNVISESSKIKMEYVEHQQDLKIRFNRIDLESVISNLMVNSIEALKKTKEGSGIIRLEVSYLKEGLSIKFSDNGSGIKFKDHEKIFEPFVTTNRTSDDVVYGHGLGLSIVREILRRHDGTIESSSPGYFERGATFTIKIPSSQARRVV